LDSLYDDIDKQKNQIKNKNTINKNFKSHSPDSMADELIDIYDENDKTLNLKKMKSEAHKNGLWHRAASVCIYNSHGEFLLQLRAKDKDLFPNMWDVSAAWHISAGEDPTIAAIRKQKKKFEYL